MATAALDEDHARLGRDLAELLRRLRENRTPSFSIGPQEAIDSHRLLLALLSSASDAVELHEFADALGPILARSPDERGAFERIIRDLGPAAAPPPPASTPPPSPANDERGGETGKEPGRPKQAWNRLAAKPGRLVAAILILLLMIALAIWLVRPGASNQTGQPSGLPADTRAAAEPSAFAEGAPPTLPPASDHGGSGRAEYVALLHGGAPTLREIARELAPTASVPLTAEDYLRRLKVLTGLPADRPIAMSASEPAGGPIVPAVRVKWAIGEIEYPGEAPSFREVEMQPGSGTPDYTVDEIMSYVPEPGGEFDTSVRSNAPTAAIVSDRRTYLPEEMRRRLDVSDEMLARAVALEHPDWNPPDAPWLPERPVETQVPGWIPWVAALAAALLAAWLALPLLDPRRAFLRRRPPRARPHRARLISNMPQVALAGPATYREIRKSLQRREPRPTRMLDIRATIRATLSAGGIGIVPRFASTKAAPDYLVLVDRKSLTDLEADRAAALVAPLRTGAIGVDLYYFNSDPSRVYSENGGSAVAIEELMARYPHHRLILMGSGEEMLDLYSGRATGGYARLGHWRRRGLLTPVPRREWAREESLIAREFNAPVARSTGGGLLALARNLLAETGRRPTLFQDGDEGATPLPRPLARLLREAPGKGESADPDFVEELLAELSFYPDAPGFEWLCAIAVYPAATFDLAMFLGRRLPEWTGAPEGWTLYTPARLAALTRLPWLREGRIPDWLRRGLIARLSPDRAGQVRGAILALVASAEEVQGEAGNRAGFGKDQAKGPAPQRLFDDEVMVEFLRSGKAEDLEVDLPGPKPPLKSIRERIDLYFIAAAALILACAAAAWYVAPRPGDGPAAPILWVPLASLALAGLGIAIAVRPASASLAARRVAIASAPAGLVVAFLAAGALVIGIARGAIVTSLLPALAIYRQLAGSGSEVPAHVVERATGPSLGWFEILLALFALIMWPFGEQMKSQMRHEPMAAGFSAFGQGRIWARALVGLLVAGFIVYLASSYQSGGVYYLAAIVVLGLVWFAAGVRARLPSRIPPQPDLARLRNLSPGRAAATFAPALLLLILPIWAAVELRGDRIVAAPADAYDRVVATSADGSLIAMTGGSDGRTISVVAAEAPGSVLWRRQIKPLRRFARAIGSPMTDSGRIVSLAVARHPREPGSFYGAAATLDGTVLMFDWRNGAVAISQIGRHGAPISPPHLAVGPDGMIAYDAHLIDGSTGIVIDGRLVSLGGAGARIDRAEQRRVTALTLLGSHLVWTGANGEVTAGKVVPGDRAGAYSLQLLNEVDGPHDRLSAGARLIRPVAADAGRPRFIAVADDGSAVLGTIDPAKNNLSTKRVRSIPQLALGPVVPWSESLPTDDQVQDPGPPRPSPRPIGRGRLQPGSQPPVARAADTAAVLGNLEKLVASGSGPRSIAQLLQQIGATPSDAGLIEKTIASEGGSGGGLGTNRQLAAFLAVIATETASFRYTEEMVRSGIDRNSDAYRYRSRGVLMIGGRFNYQQIGQIIGVDLIANPDLMSRPDISTRAALAYWRSHNINAAADKGDMGAVYRRVTGNPSMGARAQRMYELILRGLEGARAQATSS